MLEFPSLKKTRCFSFFFQIRIFKEILIKYKKTNSIKVLGINFLGLSLGCSKILTSIWTQLTAMFIHIYNLIINVLTSLNQSYTCSFMPENFICKIAKISPQIFFFVI